VNGRAPGDGRVEVFFDGQCPMCRASREWAERRDAGGRLAWIDASDPAAADRLPVSAAELARAVLVRGRDGSIASGYRAWLAVLAELPGWRGAARLLGLPPLAWLGPPVYRLVAVLRHALGGSRRR
jgi:predicted DCC family thiol-disulfide oxidoreductase YuxK